MRAHLLGSKSPCVTAIWTREARGLTRRAHVEAGLKEWVLLGVYIPVFNLGSAASAGDLLASRAYASMGWVAIPTGGPAFRLFYGFKIDIESLRCDMASSFTVTTGMM